MRYPHEHYLSDWPQKPYRPRWRDSVLFDRSEHRSALLVCPASSGSFAGVASLIRFLLILFTINASYLVITVTLIVALHYWRPHALAVGFRRNYIAIHQGLPMPVSPRAVYIHKQVHAACKKRQRTCLSVLFHFRKFTSVIRAAHAHSCIGFKAVNVGANAFERAIQNKTRNEKGFSYINRWG